MEIYKLRIITAKDSEYNMDFWKPDFTSIENMENFPLELTFNTLEYLREAIENNGFPKAPSMEHLIKVEKYMPRMVVHRHIKNDKGEYIPEGYLISTFEAPENNGSKPIQSS